MKKERIEGDYYGRKRRATAAQLRKAGLMLPEALRQTETARLRRELITQMNASKSQVDAERPRLQALLGVLPA
eukprot:6003414-Prymnesium_polylepis.1